MGRASPPPPESEQELLRRASNYAGCSLGELAAEFGKVVPPDLHGHKGWVGNLVEFVLGATAGSRDVPDFEGIGVELKTLPIDARGRPAESTFVCTIPLLDVARVEYTESRVRRKLSRVLWMPVQGERSMAVASRRLGTPHLWSPSPVEDEILRFDWETLAGLIGSGDVERITGHLGTALQVRPKARDGSARRWGLDEDGVRVRQLPRGFYLRSRFTHGIIERMLGNEPKGASPQRPGD
jgi:DNA mismatch repair protein MutH